ncbi:MAG: hypothetical protein KJ964_05835 [Verrucomicrobia bacterium]|nr:hypothetical protein [Verrucomicrobiota bacterium]MBU1735708.1 hypothetical protein [Verrucomicrobiota bacterium]MBU1856448.1 hypothetical protein [Verrucomicrobiota bacterium]
MQAIINQTVPITKLTDGGGCCFFGYYDVAAFDTSGRFYLYHKVDFMDRQPTRADSAEFGVINIETKAKIKIAETTAWNFQQGAMLQWNPAAPDSEVIYNIRVGETYRAVVKNIKTQKERMLEMPIAALDPKGRYALGINFSRLFDFRPGYGYHGIVDANKNLEAPEDDGVFHIDMLAGKSRLILSLQQIHRLLQDTASVVKNGKIVINHITCNTDGSRFVLLVRNFPEHGGKWGTAAITANADGSDPYVLNDHSMTSHYHWRDEQHLLAYAKHAEGDQLYLLRDKSQEYQIIDRDFFKSDGHCSYAPDRNQILYDSYPENNYRHLYVYDIHGHKGYKLASLYSAPVLVGDIRCDLHPRWHSNGKLISFDSTHENQRHIYLAQLT